MTRTTTRITRLLLAALLSTALCACGGGTGDCPAGYVWVDQAQQCIKPVPCTELRVCQ